MAQEILGKECKFSFWLPAIQDVRDDTHIIKEIIHYKDGTKKPNLKIISNYKRPFWITKQHLQNHKEKKESEYLENLNAYSATQSSLGREVGIRLGQRYIGRTSIRDVQDSPFIYGLDVDSRVNIKKAYVDKYPDMISSFETVMFDIETDVDKGDITVISICAKDKIYTAFTKKFLGPRETNLQEQLNHLYTKYIPQTNISIGMKREYVLVENELDLIKVVFAKLHEWEPDIVAVWNIKYDIGVILEALETYNVHPKTIFCDPRLPDSLKSFRFKMGSMQKVTESGVVKPVSPEEQWHVIDAPASFYWVDAMSAHRFVRVGGKSIPGGYGLNNILKFELGDKLGKLTFPDETTVAVNGIDWHRFMSKNRPLEYIIYNQWDVISMHHLDEKTKDLSGVLAMLSNLSSFDVFNSGPKKIMDAMHFFYLENGRVLGSKPTRAEEDDSLGLGNWIVLLPSHRIKENGAKVIAENPDLVTNTRFHVYDSDQVSGYPSDGMAANVSKDTTVREIIDIKGIEKEEYKLQNINLMFGKVNHVEYCETMFNFPSLLELKEKITAL